MTRVNVGYSPRKLSGKMLIAEHREIKRIPNMVKKKDRIDRNKIPKTFCLGPGHVTFFYDKLGFLLRRYRLIHNECIRRGFDVQDFSSAWENIPACLMGEYKPNRHDRKLISDRIKERLKNK